jgi:hypothetical protein
MQSMISNQGGHRKIKNLKQFIFRTRPILTCQQRTEPLTAVLKYPSRGEGRDTKKKCGWNDTEAASKVCRVVPTYIE